MKDFGDHLRTTGGALKNWAVAQLQDSLAVGVLWLIGLYILHVPLAPMWAVIAAVLQIVPHLGPILGLFGPVLAATIRWMDWEHPLGVLVLYATIVLFDGLVLQPYIMRRTAKVPIWASVLTPISGSSRELNCRPGPFATTGGVILRKRPGCTCCRGNVPKYRRACR